MSLPDFWTITFTFTSSPRHELFGAEEEQGGGGGGFSHDLGLDLHRHLKISQWVGWMLDDRWCFGIYPLNLGEMIQIDEHIFQMGGSTTDVATLHAMFQFGLGKSSPISRSKILRSVAV